MPKTIKAKIITLVAIVIFNARDLIFGSVFSGIKKLVSWICSGDSGGSYGESIDRAGAEQR